MMALEESRGVVPSGSSAGSGSGKKFWPSLGRGFTFTHHNTDIHIRDDDGEAEEEEYTDRGAGDLSPSPSPSSSYYSVGNGSFCRYGSGSGLGGMLRRYVCDHPSAPPKEQVITTDPQNILIRSLHNDKKRKQQQHKDKDKASGSGSGKGKESRTTQALTGTATATGTGMGMGTNKEKKKRQREGNFSSLGAATEGDRGDEQDRGEGSGKTTKALRRPSRRR